MKKILIVDDDTDLLLALRIRLKSRGYATVLASDASMAIQKAVQEKPDLILLDVGLPDQNGFLVLDNLKQNSDLASIPVIVVSARPSDVYRDAAVMAGAKAYFEKPFNNEELLHEIRNALTPSFANP
jgi:two-component system KDP operon response regulator KdpE